MTHRTIALAAAALLAGCGGSDDPITAQAQRFEEARPAAAARDARRRALAAVPFVQPADAAQQLMAFAERTYPDLFPAGAYTRSMQGWWFRYYPGTGTYLAVIDWRVYVMGGPLGPEVRDMGELTSYITITSTPPLITALRLASCPNGSVVEAPNYAACMAGSIAGTQLFDRTKPCSFKIEADGTTVLESGGQRMTVTPAAFGRALYTKTTGSSSYLDLSVYSRSDAQYVAFDIETIVRSGLDWFAVGGELQVSARQLSPEASMSCTFAVTRAG